MGGFESWRVGKCEGVRVGGCAIGPTEYGMYCGKIGFWKCQVWILTFTGC